MTAGPYGLLLDAVRGVRWPAARRVGGAAPGAHPSTLRGSSTEFSEFRPYRQGDDPRRLDWRLLARSDRAYVRLADDHRTLGTSVIVDASASMAFPADTREKWVRAREVAIGLLAVAHAGGDPVGLMIAGPEPVSLAPRGRRSVLFEMIRALDDTVPAGAARLGPVFAACRAGRIVILTDLLCDADALLVEARRRVARGGEVVIVHLVSADELDPPAGVLLAVDPEDPTLRRMLDADARVAYRSALDAWLEHSASAFRAAGVRYLRAESRETAPRLVRRVAGGAAGMGAR